MDSVKEVGFHFQQPLKERHLVQGLRNAPPKYPVLLDFRLVFRTRVCRLNNLRPRWNGILRLGFLDPAALFWVDLERGG
jgi:hypothetical protein